MLFIGQKVPSDSFTNIFTRNNNFKFISSIIRENMFLLEEVENVILNREITESPRSMTVLYSLLSLSNLAATVPVVGLLEFLLTSLAPMKPGLGDPLGTLISTWI